MEKYLTYLYGLLLIVGALCAVLDVAIAPYLFGCGSLAAFLQSVIRLWRNRNAEKTEIRQYRLLVYGSSMLLLSTYLLFKGANSWVVPALIYGVTILYMSYRIK